MPPLIGIIPAVRENSEIYLPFSYQNAIERSGGESLVLPLTKNVSAIARSIDICSGFLFIGGPDPSPLLYGKEADDGCIVNNERDENDRLYFEQIFSTGKPVIGICRGLQIINVLLGGSLYFDIPEHPTTGTPHGKDGRMTRHTVRVMRGTPLFSVIKAERIQVSSQHHQGILRLGTGLAPMAYAPDGLIEAVYHKSHPYLRAYQWHPERSVNTDVESTAIFRDFLSACWGDGE